MAESRIRMTHMYGQTPPNVHSDFDWIRRHEKELLAQYGEGSIIVYQKQVLGSGATYDEALKNAEASLSPDMGEVTPVHERLSRRHPFLRVMPQRSGWLEIDSASN